MKDRYKVIADYPKSIYEVGTVINAGFTSEDLLYCDWSGPRMRDYPHLFRKMDWKEDRTIEQMPQYLKFINDEGKTDFVLKVEKYIKHKESSQLWAFEYLWKNEPDLKRMSLTGWLPASLEEYQSQSQTV